MGIMHEFASVVSLAASSITIGAIEIKDALTAALAKVGLVTGIAETDNALAVQAPVLGVTTGAALDADGTGTHQQYLRGLLKAFLARVTACNTGAIAGAVTANAGTNLNTSGLATEAGGHLASLDTKITTCNTGAVAGSVTANAGTNLNTSGLATEAGGHLASIDAKIIDYPTAGTPTVLAISGVSAATGAALAAGKYLLFSEVRCGWVQAASPTSVLATDPPLPAGVLVPVTLANLKLAAITGGGTGNLYIIPVS